MMPQLQNRQSTLPPTIKHPTLSVIVPVYNGIDDLNACLAALAASDYHDFDVLVVDDGSTEPVEPLVTAYGFRYLRLDGPRGPAWARNHGVTHVKGRYVVFIDADVCVHQNTLRQFAEAFATDATLAAIIGSYDNAPAAPNFVSRYKNLFHHYVHQQCAGDINTFWSGCGAIRHDLFLDSGGYDAKRYPCPAVEDIELGMRIRAAGHRIVLDRRLQVTHLKRWTLWSLLKTDIFHRGIPWMRLMLQSRKLANTLNVEPAQRLSVALVYLSGLSVLAAVWWPRFWLAAALSALAVTVCNRDFYRYFTRCAGLWFTIRVVPLHWLYFAYCGFCVVWSVWLHYRTKVWKPRYR